MSEEISMQIMLDEIQTTIREAMTDIKPTQIILAGDFNCHHPVWSNKAVNYLLLRHTEELLAFIQDNRIQ